MAEQPAQNLRIAIYARVSGEEQREGQNIDSQIAELERFAVERHWTVTGVYKDDGWSGSIMARPELDHLRDDASKGVFQAVLINDVDRLARDVTHLGVVKRDLEKRGIQVIFRKLPAESSPTHNLMVNILGSFAEFERELIMDRTRRGRRHKVEVRQQYLGGNTSYGYRYIAKDRAAGKGGVLEVNPEEAMIVRQMFSWVTKEGLSARRVRDRLNERAVPPQKGRRWGKSSVLRILHNEMYAGTWYYNKFQGCEPKTRNRPAGYRRRIKTSVQARPVAEWIALKLPPSLGLVSRDEWTAVQEQLRLNTAFSPRNIKHEYLLRGLVRCAGCNSLYSGDPDHGRFAYRCRERCRKCPSIKEDRLNDAVWNAIREAVLNPALIMAQAKSLSADRTKTLGQNQNLATQVDAALSQIASEETRLLEAYRLSVITPQQLGQQLEMLTSRRLSLENQRAQLLTAQPTCAAGDVKDEVESFCRVAAANFDSFTLTEKQQFLRLIVRQVTFDGRQAQIRGCIPLGQQGLTSLNEPQIGSPQQDRLGFQSGGSIETTKIGHHGRNIALEADFQLKVALSTPKQAQHYCDRGGRFSTYVGRALPTEDPLIGHLV